MAVQVELMAAASLPSVASWLTTTRRLSEYFRDGWAGYYQANIGSKGCLPCDNKDGETFQELKGQTICKSCPANTRAFPYDAPTKCECKGGRARKYTKADSACMHCLTMSAWYARMCADYWKFHAKSGCLPCPVGADCNVRGPSHTIRPMHALRYLCDVP